MSSWEMKDIDGLLNFYKDELKELNVFSGGLELSQFIN
jgi:hypothetical protein